LVPRDAAEFRCEFVAALVVDFFPQSHLSMEKRRGRCANQPRDRQPWVWEF
jgi:hypothetical protein